MILKISKFFAACMFLISSASYAADINPLMDAKSCEPPKYPKSSLMNEETGTVYLEFVIGPDGKMVESKVAKSSGSSRLDKAALSALSLCSFKAGTKDGKAAQMTAKIEFVWKLD
jgi:protein TonB